MRGKIVKKDYLQKIVKKAVKKNSDIKRQFADFTAKRHIFKTVNNETVAVLNSIS